MNGLLTRYLLDTQPGLAQVIAEATGSNVTHHLHSPRGIHASYTGGQRTDSLTDGLGSVRARIDATGDVLKAVSYTPYGVPNTDITGFAFTGEPRDLTRLQHHRARYYAPGLAMWASLDPWEGAAQRPMSLNSYSWVEGNVVNATDASGLACDCDRYIKVGQSFEFQQYIACLIDIRNSTLSDIALNSAVIIYAFLDGVVNSNQSRCNLGRVPSSMSMGTITHSGIYTHDHYSKLVPDFNSQPLIIRSTPAINAPEAQQNLSSYGCIEFRGSTGTKAVKGIDLQYFASPANGIVVIAGNYTDIGCPARLSNISPRLGDTVFFVSGMSSAIGTEQFTVQRIDPLGGESISGDITPIASGLNHSELRVGQAEVTEDYRQEAFRLVGQKYVFGTDERNNSSPIVAGNSGSGWFNENFELIGVTAGQGLVNQLFRVYNAEYFSPLKVPNG